MDGPATLAGRSARHSIPSTLCQKQAGPGFPQFIIMDEGMSKQKAVPSWRLPGRGDQRSSNALPGWRLPRVRRRPITTTVPWGQRVLRSPPSPLWQQFRRGEPGGRRPHNTGRIAHSPDRFPALTVRVLDPASNSTRGHYDGWLADVMHPAAAAVVGVTTTSLLTTDTARPPLSL
jgi:hypothetical protein